MLQKEDIELLERCKEGCEGSIQELWETQGKRAVRSVRNMLKDKTPSGYVSQSYIEFREMIKLFNPDRGATFYTAFCARLKRENQGLTVEQRSRGGIKQPRNAKDIPEVSEFQDQDAVHWDPIPEFEANEVFQRAEKYLTIRQAQIAELRIFQGLSLREIEVEIDLSYGQVFRDWTEALEILRTVVKRPRT